MPHFTVQTTNVKFDVGKLLLHLQGRLHRSDCARLLLRELLLELVELVAMLFVRLRWLRCLLRLQLLFDSRGPLLRIASSLFRIP
jgi:hypothetical protein